MTEDMRAMIVFGALEQVSLPDFGIKKTTAKIDTGAYNGALHCENIRLNLDKNGKKVLRFRPLSKDHPIQTVHKFKKVEVTSASGHAAKRYVIPITLRIKGQTYESLIGLTSRKDMSCPVLIGRRFLRENNIIVDVSKNQELNSKSEVF